VARWNPFSISYEKKCRDGSRKTVYKKVEDAFPLAINGYEANIATKLKSELLQEGELNGALKTKVDGLLYGLDDINNGLMIAFRSAYVGYQTDPCENNEFLLTEIRKINEEQRRLRALRMQIRGYVEMAKTNPGNTTELAELYNTLVNKIGAYSMGDAGVQEAIDSSREAANKLMEDE
jgi:hypothetical protein